VVVLVVPVLVLHFGTGCLKATRKANSLSRKTGDAGIQKGWSRVQPPLPQCTIVWGRKTTSHKLIYDLQTVALLL